MSKGATHELSTSATAVQLSGDFDTMFGKITTQMLHQQHYAGSALKCCAGNDVECEAMVSALIASHDAMFDDIVGNLKDTIDLLLVRVKELEAVHV
jgi:hypothetical protein